MSDDPGETAHRLSSGLWVVGCGQGTETPTNVLLLAEIDSSISFINVAFVVCTALLLFNFEALDDAPFAAAALIVSIVAFMFGGLCIANASGALARGGSTFAEATRALNWGNIFSEWFGIYMLIFALPAIVEVSSPTSLLGGAALAATATAFIAYAINGFDILNRLLREQPGRRYLLHAAALAGTALHWAGVAFGGIWVSGSGAALFAAVAVVCAVTHVRSPEFSPRRSWRAPSRWRRS